MLNLESQIFNGKRKKKKQEKNLIKNSITKDKRSFSSPFRTPSTNDVYLYIKYNHPRIIINSSVNLSHHISPLGIRDSSARLPIH